MIPDNRHWMFFVVFFYSINPRGLYIVYKLCGLNYWCSIMQWSNHWYFDVNLWITVKMYIYICTLSWKVCKQYMNIYMKNWWYRFTTWMLLPHLKVIFHWPKRSTFILLQECRNFSMSRWVSFAAVFSTFTILKLS